MLDQGEIKPDADAGGPSMIGGSEPMRSLRTRMRSRPDLGNRPHHGREGTGKELVAQAVFMPPVLRKQQPLGESQLPRPVGPLMESELFGHERGASPARTPGRTGRFRAGPTGGTILLDEITEIDLGLQAKLLRVLQERAV